MCRKTVDRELLGKIAYIYLRNQERFQWFGKIIMRRKKKEEDYLRGE